MLHPTIIESTDHGVTEMRVFLLVNKRVNRPHIIG